MLLCYIDEVAATHSKPLYIQFFSEGSNRRIIDAAPRQPAKFQNRLSSFAVHIETQDYHSLRS
jgi:hypothetical protein